MSRMRTTVAGVGLATLLGMGAVVAVATSSGAQTDPTDAEAPMTSVTEVEEAPAERGELELDAKEGACEFDECDEKLCDEELAELEAEVAALTTALDEAGVEYELVPEDELGIAFPEPAGDDPAAWEAFDAVLMEQWAEEFASLPIDEQAEIVEHEQAVADELRTALDDAGVSYALEADPVTGVEFPVFDEDDEQAWEVLEELEKLELDDPFLDELDAGDEHLGDVDDDQADELDDDLEDDDDIEESAAA